MIIEEFLSKYETTNHELNSFKFRGIVKEEWFYRDGRERRIDYKKIIKRYEFKRRVIHKSQDNYYFLIKNLSEMGVADMIAMCSDIKSGQFYSYMNKQLFSQSDKGIFDFNISPIQWSFFRISNAIINEIFRKSNVSRKNRDLYKIYN